MTQRVTTLSNGLRVATDTIAHVETATVGMWVDVGSRQEPEEINGISHVLEHMAFKGTQRRTALQIAEEIEDVGGYLNAYTSRESTAYHARVLKNDLPLALDILGDILQNSAFDAEEFAREQSVIIQEIGQTDDTPDDIIFDYFQTVCFPNQPLGRPILGSTKIINSLTAERVRNYMKAHYGARQMVLAAAGNLDHDEVVRLAESHFGDLPDLPVQPLVPATFVGGKFEEERDLEQTHWLIGFEAVSSHDPDYHTTRILSSLFGEGMSSRLFQEVREKRGLVYSIYSFASSYDDTGTFGIYANTTPEQMDKVRPIVESEIKRVCTTLTEAEVNRAKAQYKAGLFMSMESTTARCSTLSNHLLTYNRLIPVEETIKNIDDVTIPKLSKVCERIFSGKRSEAIIIGVGE